MAIRVIPCFLFFCSLARNRYQNGMDWLRTRCGPRIHSDGLHITLITHIFWVDWAGVGRVQSAENGWVFYPAQSNVCPKRKRDFNNLLSLHWGGAGRHAKLERDHNVEERRASPSKVSRFICINSSCYVHGCTFIRRNSQYRPQGGREGRSALLSRATAIIMPVYRRQCRLLAGHNSSGKAMKAREAREACEGPRWPTIDSRACMGTTGRPSLLNRS